MNQSLVPTIYSTIFHPSSQPTGQPSNQPSYQPTAQPSTLPSYQPTAQPSNQPSYQPTGHPSTQPSCQPTAQPSNQPSYQPTGQPSNQPSNQPTAQPSTLPSYQPTAQPSTQPSNQPTAQPSTQPSNQPTGQPSNQPSYQPTGQPSTLPSNQPTGQPSNQPSYQPTGQPSTQPSYQPTAQPSTQPSYQPTGQPSTQPSDEPTGEPSSYPSSKPTTQPSNQPSSEPTGEPSSNPSSKPTTQPSNQPSDEPTGEPSSNPSEKPTEIPTNRPSWRPTSAPTLTPSQKPTSPAPTITPTSSPTQDLYHYNSTAAYLSYNSAKLKAENTSKSTVYAYFAYRETVVDGSCPVWKKFVTGLFALPIDQYFSTLSYSLGYYSPPMNPVYVQTFACTSRTSLSTLLSSFHQQLLSSKSLNLQVSCGNHNWQVFLCNNSVILCVDCDFQCSCPDSVYILNPCASSGDCNINQATYRILTFTYTSILAVPQVDIVSIVPDRLSIILKVSMNMEGRVYCFAAPINSTLSSPLYVRQYGAFTLIITEDTVTPLTMSGLSPSTTYDVYLYAESLVGQGMDLAEVQATKTRITTSCCYSILFTTKYSYLLPYSASTAAVVDSNVFTFTLDFIPSQSLFVNVSVLSVGCGSSTPSETSRAVALPSSFMFRPGLLSPRSSFVLHGSVGCYAVTVFPVSVGTIRNVTVTVTIYSSLYQPSPTITAAAFSNDGSMLLIDFDSIANNGASAVPSEFACNKVLFFVGASYARCKWSSSRSLVAVIDGSKPAPSVGDSVGLLSSLVRPSTPFLNIAPQSAIIQPPPDPFPPLVALSTDATIGSCDDIVLDPTASSGSGGRPWSKVQWMVSGSAELAADAKAISHFLNTHYNTSTKWVIRMPKSYYTSSGSLLITLLLQNFLGVSSASASTITISSNASIPRVTIAGPGQVTIFRSDSLQLFASASVPSCVNVSSLALTYSWKVFIDQDYLPYITSKSRNDRVFFLPSNSLNALTTYTIQVTVTTESGFSNSDFIRVFVERSGVRALIAGGSQRTVSSGEPLTVDASSSEDIDYTNSSNLIFSWSCFISEPIYGTPCQLNLPNVATLYFSSRMLFTDTTYVFEVTVVSARDGMFSFATASIALTSQPSPLISFNNIYTVYNVDNRIVVIATINATSNFLATWSCLNCNFNLSSVSRSYLTISFSGGLQSVSLAINPNSLTAGLSYTFQLSAAYAATPTTQSSASASIVGNGPPYGGMLSVSPSEGYVFSTIFYFNTFEWVDVPSDYPLQYTMGYFPTSIATVFFVQHRNPLSYVNTYLGQGLVSSGYEVTCIVYTSDIYGATANATTAVLVFPSQSVHSLRSTMYQLLADAEATLNPDLTSSVVNAVASHLNSANCTLALNCIVLNRTTCSSVAQTCGPCIDGYLGIAGPSNTPCQLGTALRPAGSSCLRDSDCITHRCIIGICRLSSKLCPSNCTSAWHGNCVHVDGNGVPVDFCDANNLNCQSKCSCHVGWYGSDCSLTWEQYETNAVMREKMCASYYTASFIQVCFYSQLSFHYDVIFVYECAGRILRSSCVTRYDYRHHHIERSRELSRSPS